LLLHLLLHLLLLLSGDIRVRWYYRWLGGVFD
jgi:hypothetical protein